MGDGNTADLVVRSNSLISSNGNTGDDGEDIDEDVID